jgi:chromosome partitioning protein
MIQLPSFTQYTPLPKDHSMQITIAVLNQKGGTGKTTLATHLAAAAHLAGARTLVLDLDRQGSAFDWYAARAEGSRLDGLTVARAGALSVPKFRELSRGYGVVVCDGPPRLGDVSRSAAVAADVVVIPLRPGPLDWWASTETLELLESADEICAQLGRGPVRRLFVVNGVNASSRLAGQAVEAITTSGGEVVGTVGNRVGFPQSMFTGETVLTTAPGSRAADEIGGIYAAVLAAVAPSEAA